MKKSIADLEAIRQKAQQQVNIRKDTNGIRVVIGMATCGIAAGARPVMLSFIEQINRRNLTNVTVSQTGCIGMCRLEPMVEVYVPGQEKVTYVKVNTEMVEKIVVEHLVNGNPFEAYTIGAAE